MFRYAKSARVFRYALRHRLVAKSARVFSYREGTSIGIKRTKVDCASAFADVKADDFQGVCVCRYIEQKRRRRLRFSDVEGDGFKGI